MIPADKTLVVRLFNDRDDDITAMLLIRQDTVAYICARDLSPDFVKLASIPYEGFADNCPTILATMAKMVDGATFEPHDRIIKLGLSLGVGTGRPGAYRYFGMGHGGNDIGWLSNTAPYFDATTAQQIIAMKQSGCGVADAHNTNGIIAAQTM